MVALSGGRAGARLRAPISPSLPASSFEIPCESTGITQTIFPYTSAKDLALAAKLTHLPRQGDSLLYILIHVVSNQLGHFNLRKDTGNHPADVRAAAQRH